MSVGRARTARSAAAAALASSASQADKRPAGSMARNLARMSGRVRKFAATKAPSATPIRSLLRGTIAVCGIGRPSGRRNTAVTANQSASAPTTAASAPARTSRIQKSGDLTRIVARKMAAAPINRAVARRRLRRSAARCAVSIGSGGLSIACASSILWPMDHIAVSIGIGIVAFASTNIDDLVLLIGFFADPAYQPRQVVGGQFTGIAALVALSLLGALAAQLVTSEEVGLLGLVPIAIGGDNLSLYIPLFAAHDGGDVALFVAIFLAMTALWCAAGYALVSGRPFGIPAERWGAASLPYVLIALGVYILARTGALAWLG